MVERERLCKAELNRVLARRHELGLRVIGLQRPLVEVELERACHSLCGLRATLWRLEVAVEAQQRVQASRDCRLAINLIFVERPAGSLQAVGERSACV
jgi:hypothetical protein